MFTGRQMISTWIWWLVYPVLGLPLTAATMTLPVVADTSIFSGKADNNLGGTTLVSGTNQQYSQSRAMFRFDLTTLPAGAVVTDAQVLLTVTTIPDPDQHGGPVNSDFGLHRLFVSWGEGTGSNATGSGAQAGNATWNQRHFGSTGWASPGALIGVDYAETPSATTFVSIRGDYLWGSSAGLVDDVKAWQLDPAANFGFILVSQNEAALGTGRRFGSKEQPGGLISPAQLVVTYTVVPEPAVAGLWFIGLTGLVFLRVRRG